MNYFKNLVLTIVLSSSLFGCRSHPSSRSQATPSGTPAAAVTAPEGGAETQVCCGGQGEETQPSERQVGIASHNFGQVEQGDVLEHQFSLTNTGAEEVSFAAPPDLSLPCCMEAKVEPELVKPGETARVTVSFDTRMRPGPFDLFVKLFPNGKGLTDTLHLGGIVRPAFVVSTTELVFDAPGSLSFEVGGEELGKTFQIQEVSTNAKTVAIADLGQGKYQATWDGKPFGTGKSAPVIYVITNSDKYGWFPIILSHTEEVKHR
jgi:Protein of unknown function (DUF1573)